ncbi:MAG TPA: AraC family transcriptional regulator [Xanthobacteraceae bacterium]|nr:AraC family transcriptional regulator [Xanthobacteraceae bacterium]
MGDLAPVVSSAVIPPTAQPSVPLPGIACAPVRFTPAGIAERDIARWNGVAVDTVSVTRREPYEFDLLASCHLLIMAERGERDEGETLVDGLPTSTRRKCSGRLSFVPSGHRFRGWGKPRLLTRVTYFYIDPRGPLLDPELHFAETEFKPRLYFYDRDLWAIAAKLKAAHAMNGAPGQRQYAEALGILLAHELLRLDRGVPETQSYIRGGLAAWQRSRVAEYIEAHLAENVLLSSLAEVAQLSPFHFSRAFKQSFGMPPLRYLASRRIERAKDLLAGDRTVTQVGLAVGFAETSSFTTAFRKHTGVTPTAFRRGLE